MVGLDSSAPFWERDYLQRGPTTVKEDVRYMLANLPVSQFRKKMILFILRRHFPQLPRDPRSLLQTPRESTSKAVPGGTLLYMGLSGSLQTRLADVINHGIAIPQNLTVQVHIDGLKLYGSSRRHLWPILAGIKELPRTKIFPVAIFWGDSKPADIDSFLADFVAELILLLKEGIYCVSENLYSPIKLGNIVCDTPARAFVKQVKGHTGYFGCDKCIQKGLRVDNTMTYPSSGATSRNDANFRRRQNVQHHIGLSPFERLPIDMIHSFALGVFRGNEKTT